MYYRLQHLRAIGWNVLRNSAPLGPKLSRSNTELALQVGDSRTQIQRYIRLTELIRPLLDQVDEGRIALRPAVELSYLTPEEQELLADTMSYMEATLSHDQAIRLRRLSEQGNLPLASIEEIMREPKPNQREQIRFNKEDFGKYFQPGCTQAQMKQDILHGLELLRRERQRNNSRDVR